MKKKLNEQGFFIVLILTAIAVVAVVTLLILNRTRATTKESANTNVSFQSTSIINRISTMVQNETAWRKTIYDAAKNPGFSCLTTPSSCSSNDNNDPPANTYPVPAPGGNFKLLDVGGVVFYDGTSATNGFDLKGDPCNTFNFASGNSQCPYHVVLYWVSKGVGPSPTYTANTTCGNPCTSYTVKGYLVYKPTPGSEYAKLAVSSLKNSFSVSKVSTGNFYYCCSLGCTHLTGDTGVANVTVSVLAAANCYAGSSEIPNDICDRAMFRGSGLNDWAPSGTPVATAGQCAQGAP